MGVEQKLQSERFDYRSLQMADVTERYVAWLNDPEVNEFLESKYELQTLASVQAFVQHANEQEDTWLFGIFERERGQHIGNIKFEYINRRHCRGDLGIVIGEKEYWGKGVATEAIETVIRFLIHELGVERISAGCFEMNHGSVRAFEKAGFYVEGVLQNNILYGDRRVNGILLGTSLEQLRADGRM